ncbi:hypothetical protein ACTA71_006770 [Dictyostelium dimigraforme]
MSTTVIYETTFTYSGQTQQNVECSCQGLATSTVVAIIQNSSSTMFYASQYPITQFTITFFTNDGKVIGNKNSNSSLPIDSLNFSSDLVKGQTYKIKIVFTSVGGNSKL